MGLIGFGKQKKKKQRGCTFNEHLLFTAQKNAVLDSKIVLADWYFPDLGCL